MQESKNLFSLSLTICFFFFLLQFISRADAVVVTKVPNCGSCLMTDMLWASAKVCFVQTDDNNIWRTADDGQTWSLQFSGAIGMDQFAANPTFLVFWTTRRTWFTNDGGVTYTATNVSFTIDTITPHPTQLGWALALAGSYCNYYPCSLYYTTNSGASWVSIPGSIYIYEWGNQPSSPSTIFTLNNNLEFGYISDFKNFNRLFTGSVGFVVLDQYVYVGISKSLNRIDLYVSSNRSDPSHTNRNSYAEVDFPFGADIPADGYNFIDSYRSIVWVGVRHTDTWGNIYSSAYSGSKFLLSLSSSPQYALIFDFDRATSNPGTYIGNVLTTLPNGPRKTVISFDNGGEWRALTPPSVDSQNRPINCPGCSLHLHGLNSYIKFGIPPFYSTENAVGLMLAVGNVGMSLDNTVANLRTYTTRDGGLTWTELFNTTTIYEFGDHGGILVFARNDAPTDTIYYSLDEGLTINWFKYTTGAAENVVNILSEFGATSINFILWTIDNNGKHHWYGLNFTDIQPRVCVPDDYETWSPSDGEHGTVPCVLGHTVVFERRKQAAQCFNDRDTEHIKSYTRCTCAFEDYECDAGYDASERNYTDGFTCTPSDPNDNPLTNCVPGQSYVVPTGYIIIPDDDCQGGLNLLPTAEKVCPQPTKKGGSNGKVIGAVVVVLLVVGFAAAIGVALWKKPEWRDMIADKFRSGIPYSRMPIVNDTDDRDDENPPQ